MTTPNMNRQPQGIPVGGQFAATTHSEPDVALGAPARSKPLDAVAAFNLGKAGLQGDLTPYAGDNPDAGEAAMSYVSPRGHELVISGAGTEDCQIHHFDPSEENTFATGGFDGRDPAATVKAVNEAVWDLEVRDAFDSGFSDGDVYEIRDTELGRTADGMNYAAMMIRDDEDNEFTVRHNYDTGKTVVSIAGYGPLDGPARDAALDSIIVDMAEEPDNGDNDLAAARAFERIRSDAAKATGSADYISARDLSVNEAKMHEFTDSVRTANPDMSTQAARNITAVGIGAEIGLAYLEAARQAREPEVAGMYIIATQTVKDLPAKMLEHKDDTAKLREDIEQARGTLRRNGSMLDAFSPSGRQPIFKQLDDTLKEMDGFISGP